jgi:hypothetical protein
VDYNGQKGYLFDGYLLTLAPVGDQEMEAYWTELSAVKSSNTQPPVNDVNYYSYQETTWNNGVHYLSEGYEGGNSSTLTLPAGMLSLQEAYLFGMTETLGYKENPYTCEYNEATKVIRCFSADDMGMVEVGFDSAGNVVIKDSYAD